VDGRANEACIDFLAKLLDIPRSSISIISGQSNRNKVVRIAGFTPAYIRRILQP
jgi:uncharacterized protein YggU (UPF0235/DUF167 family)